MALSSVGTAFKRSADDSSGSTYTAIAEVNSITGPGMTREFIDTTSLDTTGGYRTFISSFRDPGEIQLELNFERDNFNDFLADYENDSDVYYQIVFPDTGETTFSFAGQVVNLGAAIPNADKISVNVTIKLSGQMTISS